MLRPSVRQRCDVGVLPASDPHLSRPRFGPVAGTLTLLSFCLTFAHKRGWYLGTDRFAWYWRPGRQLGGMFSLWNNTVDMGGPSQHYLPVMSSVIWALKFTGLPPWAVQRCWFAIVVSVGAIGLALLVLTIAPRARLEAGLAGLWMICSPYTSGFFFPTSLLLNAMLCPWLVLAVWLGATTPSRWRWAGVVALCVGVSASANPPGFVLTTIPALITGVGLVVGGRTTLRRLVSWSGRAAILSALVALPVVVLSILSSATLTKNLASSESADAVSRSSSWSESFRGLGFWLQYWNPGGRLVWPYLSGYFADPRIVLATWGPPILALIALAVLPRRVRLLFGVMLACSVMIMVGAYPVGGPSPLGRLLNGLYARSSAIFAFRNVYKAGGGWLVAVGALIALGFVQLRQSTRGSSRPRLRTTAMTVGMVGLFSATGWPLISGNAFGGGERLHGEIPSYWQEAIGWLDKQPGSGRVLIVPGARVEDYRWGSAAGGDLFPALMDRPAIFAQALTGSPAAAANVTAALDRLLTSGRYEAGTLAPIAARLGIQFVVIRNDLNWQITGSARPIAFQPLRDDPTLERAAAFGNPGQDTVAAGDDSAAAHQERLLDPVEVYRIAVVNDVVRAISPVAPILLSGDGDAWPPLARSGLLDTHAPLVATATIGADSLRAALTAGAAVVLTDTNRRRSIAFGLGNATLSADDASRVEDLYVRPGSQSVTTFGDATQITYVGPPMLTASTPPFRPAAAFDGDPTTAWLTGVNAPAAGAGINIVFRKPTPITAVNIRVADPDQGRVVQSVLLISDGAKQEFAVHSGGDNMLRFAGGTTSSLSIVVLSADGASAGPFGFSEVELPGLDLRERVVMPDDLARIVDGDNGLVKELTTSPVVIEMQRLIGLPYDTENNLDRRFRLPVGRTFELSGEVRVTAATSSLGVLNLNREPFGSCRNDLVTLDGAAIPVRITGTRATAATGVAIHSCAPIEISTGWHEILTSTGVPIDWLRLSATGGRPIQGGRAVAVEVTDRDSGGETIVVDGQPGTTVIIGQAFSSTWRASSDCLTTQTPSELDVQAAWTLTSTGRCSIVVSQAGATPFTAGVWLSLATLVAAAALIIIDPLSKKRGHRATTARWPRPLVASSAVIVFAYAADGWTLALIATIAIASLARRYTSPRAVVWVAVVLVALAAAASIPPWSVPLDPVWPLWPLQRQTASDLVRLAVVLVAAAISRSVFDEASTSPL